LGAGIVEFDHHILAQQRYRRLQLIALGAGRDAKT
jgi:hypothetical protein